jgi:hypothetical protein
MRIEEVEMLMEEIEGNSFINNTGYVVALDLVEALRAEAWYPIGKAEEMGVKDGQKVLLQEDCYWFQGFYRDFWRDTRGAQCFPSHFKRITPPGN